MVNTIDREFLKKRVHEIRGDITQKPDASIVIPVNAQGDLETVRTVLSDIVRYSGSNTFEIILMINNYPEDAVPTAVIEEYESLGIVVDAKPSVRRPGEAVGFTARIHGVRAATTEIVLLFD